MNKGNRIQNELRKWKEEQLYREMTIFDSVKGSLGRVKGKKYSIFSSNNYLDMCNHDKVKKYVKETIDIYGTGSTGARLTTGTRDLHMRLEKEISILKNRPATLLFNTGYMANVGVISALCKEGDVIYSDALNHASIIDGCRLSRGKTIIYKHNDMQDLEEKIKKNTGKMGFIISDGVFSMDGDIVNLPKLVELAKKYNLLSIIDEAHATGVIGKTGKGCEEYFDMPESIDVIIGTLSKAVGSEGGFVCGSQDLIQYLMHTARSFVFSTSLSPAVIAASIQSLRSIREDTSRVECLQGNVSYFCKCMRKRGVEMFSQTAIIPIMIGEEEKAMKWMEELRERGYYVTAIRYPTVEKGKARLRVALMSSHTKEEIDGLVGSLFELMREGSKN